MKLNKMDITKTADSNHVGYVVRHLNATAPMRLYENGIFLELHSTGYTQTVELSLGEPLFSDDDRAYASEDSDKYEAIMVTLEKAIAQKLELLTELHESIKDQIALEQNSSGKKDQTEYNLSLSFQEKLILHRALYKMVLDEINSNASNLLERVRNLKSND